MLTTPQSHFNFERFEGRDGSFDSLAPLNPKTGRSKLTYHRRSVSCIPVATFDHYDPSFYDYTESDANSNGTSSGSASPTRTSGGKHVQRKSEGAISLVQLQRSLSGTGIVNGQNPEDKAKVIRVASPSLGGKLIKINVSSPAPRRSLLSDLLNNSGSNQPSNRLEQQATRRRMLKMMRRYSVDASEMDFNLGASKPPMMSGRTKLSSEGLAEESTVDGFCDTPTVRYLRNPCQTTIKTKLRNPAYVAGAGGDNGAAPDWSGEHRVW